MKRINIRIEEELRDDFKEACQANGESMTDVLLQEINRYVFVHKLRDIPYGVIGPANNIGQFTKTLRKYKEELDDTAETS